ncbi:proline iminopeptidase-family hydrolase [Cesiribacter sp. SM1]|uniref:proline iminopeptidase-family hydrolase n=1 Tax=Cesiribacter sp. SM1 TaxID=2861196 RepID=UPI001CD70571|nr:proline iminopeptidase-family hydrolase [Cesiribacter sp. SM1]
MQEQNIQLQNGHQVYTKTTGTAGTKLLTLHGGPGLTHECFANLPALLNPRGVQVIYYDQLGSYYSDMPEDTSLFSLDKFADQLYEVVEALRPDFILAHSAGVMVLVEYLLSYQHENLKGIMLMGMPGSYAKFQQNVLRLRGQLPAPVLQRMDQLEEAGKVMEPEYQQLLMQEWFGRYYCTLLPWPQPLQDCWSHFSFPVLLNTLGAGPFVFKGPWTSWDRRGDISKIAVPVQLIGFPGGLAFEEDLIQWHKELQDSRYHICSKGEHFGWWQSSEEFVSQLLDFMEYAAEVNA